MKIKAIHILNFFFFSQTFIFIFIEKEGIKQLKYINFDVQSFPDAHNKHKNIHFLTKVKFNSQTNEEMLYSYNRVPFGIYL